MFSVESGGVSIGHDPVHLPGGITGAYAFANILLTIAGSLIPLL